jgi:hypothetical protein
MEWQQPEHKQLMEQQPVRVGLDGTPDLGAERRHGLQAL